MTEGELRALIGRSQEEGFRALFQQYQGYVYAIVWDRLGGLGSREDAEECVSDIFAEIFLRFGSIQNGALHGYIGTVAKRRAINLFHKLSARTDTVSLDDNAFCLPSEEDVAGDVEADTVHRILLEKIRCLGEPDATIVIQRYYYDRKSHEIARAVHMNPITVRKRLHRALKRLRKLLSDEGISM